LSVEEERGLAFGLKELAGRCFRCIKNQIRGAEFEFANNRNMSHLYGRNKIPVDKGWYASFMKINDSIALRKPENLCRARAQGTNGKAVEIKFQYE
jgi:hypothetical protein